MTEAHGAKRLGGWTRLWVVFSVVWISGSTIVTVLSWPKHEHYRLESSPTTIESDAIDAATVATGDEWPGTVVNDAPAADGPWNDYKPTAKPNVAPSDVKREDVYEAIRKADAAGDSEAVRELAALLQAMDKQKAKPQPAPKPQYDDEAFANAKSQRLIGFLLGAFLPPILLALAMLAVDWVRRGFAR